LAPRKPPQPLAGQLRAGAEHGADVAGPLGDRVRHVRGQRRHAGREQRREQQQRPTARDRVHRSGDQAGGEQEDQLTEAGERHGLTL